MRTEKEYRKLLKEQQKTLRAFYSLFGSLGLCMICEATLEDCLEAGIKEIDRLQQIRKRAQTC